VNHYVSCMPEISGNAAILANPYDPDDIARKLCELMDNDDLQSVLVSRGLESAANLTWSKCANKTVEVYKAIV
jgi:glycosyltransferase involved in cell wall biosynthesis